MKSFGSLLSKFLIKRGLTLMEVVMSTMIISLVVGGTMTAMVTSVRVQRESNGAMKKEASGYAQQWLESMRNYVEAGDPYFSDLARMNQGWRDDDQLTDNPEVVKRIYEINKVDCDGDLVPDCYKATVRVCWNQPTCS